MSQKSHPIVYFIESIVEGPLGSFLITFILIPLLIILVLILPPVSLADRIMSIGYTRIGLHEGGSVQEPDGMEVNFLPEGVRETFRVKLDTVSRSAFVAGSLPRRWPPHR